MSGDAQTLAVYAAEAGRYADMAENPLALETHRRFMAGLPSGAHVLDLGCGPGRAARRMLDAGFVVDAVDAAPEMIAEAAARYGVEGRVARFEDVQDADAYDGIWASFSLLHAPKAEMPGHLDRLKRALRPGGTLALGLKIGTGEHRDGLGRMYAYYLVDELDGLLRDAGFTVTGRIFGEDAGLSGEVSEWQVVYADG